jgi:hypothetical protein
MNATRLLLLALLLALAWPALAAAQAAPLDLAAYEELLRAARAAAARGDRIGLDEVAPQLVAATAVRLPDGSAAPVDNGWLAEELARQDPRLDLLAARLGALIDALAAPPPSAPANAEQRLAEILSRPPFSQGEGPSEPNWLERFFEWLFEQLGRMAEPVGEAAGGQPGTVASWALIAAGVALILAVLWLWLRGLSRQLRPSVALAPPASAEARDAADARSQARELAGRGDYRAAARLLALAALLWLDESGRLRYDAHQTNREHLARLREQPQLRERLAPVVETADKVWYGNAPLDAASFDAYERQVETLRHDEAG